MTGAARREAAVTIPPTNQESMALTCGLSLKVCAAQSSPKPGPSAESFPVTVGRTGRARAFLPRLDRLDLFEALHGSAPLALRIRGPPCCVARMIGQRVSAGQLDFGATSYRPCDRRAEAR